MNWKKGLITGVIAGIVLNVLSFLFMGLPWMSAFYAQMFPQMVSAGGFFWMILSMFLIGLFMGLIYSIVNESIPGKGFRKGLRYGFIVWLLAGIMWPVMMIGFAPVIVWISELLIDLILYLVTGMVVVKVYGKE